LALGVEPVSHGQEKTKTIRPSSIPVCMSESIFQICKNETDEFTMPARPLCNEKSAIKIITKENMKKCGDLFCSLDDESKRYTLCVNLGLFLDLLLLRIFLRLESSHLSVAP
jgi:hypothetical protein